MASGTIRTIGTMYEAAWIGVSSTAGNLTDGIQVPAGTYIIVISIPNMASEGNGLCVLSANNAVDTGGFKKMYSYDSKTIIRHYTTTTTLRVVSGGATNVGISYLDRGGLKAIKIA